MADPAELEQQLQRLRQAISLKDDALGYLSNMEGLQAQRWKLLQRVIDAAVLQYISMRLDSVEERLRDQSAPLWLSVLLTVGVTLVPVTAITGSLLSALTKSTARSIRHADVKLMSLLERSRSWYDPQRAKNLAEEIKRTELLLAKYVQKWEPEIANTLQDVAHGLAETIGNQPFQQRSGRTVHQTDAPVVVVKSALDEWIGLQERVEESARTMLQKRLRDLFDIAVSPEPGKEAKAKEDEAKKRMQKEEATTGKKVMGNVGVLPKTNKEAIQSLAEERDGLADSIEKAQNMDIDDMRDLQLMIESMIWATTYDFTPVVIRHEYPMPESPSITGPRTFAPAPLPEGLWKRLIERYVDPDEGRTYKEVGNIDRLGTKAYPYYDRHPEDPDLQWSPEVRLSHYLSQVLLPQINNGNSAVVRMFSALNA